LKWWLSVFVILYIYFFVISSFGKGWFGHFLDKNILFMEKVGWCMRLQSVVIRCVFINEKQLGSGGLSSLSLSSFWKTSRVSYHLFFIFNFFYSFDFYLFCCLSFVDFFLQFHPSTFNLIWFLYKTWSSFFFYCYLLFLFYHFHNWFFLLISSINIWF